jgi:Nucleotidyl transferase AbiEii toxin, Type IV TA system
VDSVANLPAAERRLYFEQAAARHGRLSAQLMEKDFWVCWILKRLFGLDEIGRNLTFKGGTSLSKVYRVIERFSEDVDISIDRDFLGFGGDDEPEKGHSGKEQMRRIDRLKVACQRFVAGRFYSELRSAIAESLTTVERWKVELDADDPDSQSIRFQFPQAGIGEMHPYFAQSVKIELGARSDHFPVETAEIRPYLAEVIPDVLEDGNVQLRVLDAERTFWEKATILHANAHRELEKSLGHRQSRHYYDLFQLANHAIGGNALARLDLLERVVFHKNIYFKSGWARYDLAKPGTLRLIPAKERVAELSRDYEAMQPMFFGDAPQFDEILLELREVENRINS